MPTGRIYAAEADRLLGLFREWLTKVKNLHIREDGYSTGRGKVYEFFGDKGVNSVALAEQFDDFSQFLDRCVDSPEDAVSSLAKMGVEERTAIDIVRRYGVESKRLQLDIRHAREAKLLSIQHRLESELMGEVDNDAVAGLVAGLVPAGNSLASALSQSAVAGLPGAQSDKPIIVNQQIIGSVEGIVAQELHGSAEFGIEAAELVKLAEKFGGADALALQSAVYELEDEDARPVDHLGAKQQLKAFLYKLGGKVGDKTLEILQRYVESKAGL